MLDPLRKSSLMTGLLLVLNAAVADDDGHRQLGAHVHGTGQLDVVLDGDRLLIELTAPGANIVGFEHAPETAEQERTLGDALALLENPDELFALPAEAGCTAEETVIETDLTAADDDDHAEDHDEDHEDHDEHESGEIHAEFHARYAFRCDRPEQLSRISVWLFERFPGTERLQVQLLGPGGQTAATLTPDDPDLVLP
jgi:hypothetical protein